MFRVQLKLPEEVLFSGVFHKDSFDLILNYLWIHCVSWSFHELRFHFNLLSSDTPFERGYPCLKVMVFSQGNTY